jgi:hypothetical protein
MCSTRLSYLEVQAKVLILIHLLRGDTINKTIADKCREEIPTPKQAVDINMCEYGWDT